MPDNAKSPEPALPDGQILIYQDGATRLQVRLDGRTVWLTQGLIAALFQTTKQNVSLHLRNIFAEHELEADSVVKECLTNAADGKRYRTLYHDLDAILAVGYRVRSDRGTAFRQWATARLSELLVKGFTLDDERLKEGRSFGGDDFDELLERIRAIRAIRASERMIYQKITYIYATSIAPRRRRGDQEGRRVAGWRCDGHSKGRHRAGPRPGEPRKGGGGNPSQRWLCPRQRKLRKRSQSAEGQEALASCDRIPARDRRSTRSVLRVRPRVRSTSPVGTGSRCRLPIRIRQTRPLLLRPRPVVVDQRSALPHDRLTRCR